MPGIVGLITRLPRAQAEPQLLQMVAALRHEDFYDAGTWIDESLGIYLGWVSRKNSFSDGMPLKNEDGNLVLAFSGEDFAEPGVVQILKQRGHTFPEKGPSYLIHLAEENETFPASLNGRFQGLLVNRAAATATLFNDRYGMQRIYYYESRDAFYFAAEAKALLAVRPELRNADLRGLGELVSCGCVLENRTIFKNMFVLPAASSWTFRAGSTEPNKTNYFQPKEWEEQPTLEPEAYYQEIRNVFSQHLPRYFNGNEKVGMSLTGGLDSRMILAWYKSAPGALPSYSFGGPYRDCQDVIMARRVAKVQNLHHEVIGVGGEFFNRFPHYAERTVFLSDGCVDVKHSPDLYVNERARQIAPVRMTGNYGGEILRRVRAFKPVMPAPGLFQTDFVSQFSAAANTYRGLVDTHPLTFAAFRQAPWHHYGLLSLEQTQVSLRSPYLDNQFVKTVYQAPASATQSNDVCFRLIRDGDPALGRIRTDRGLLSNEVLHQYLEFTFKAEYAYDYGMPQWVAKIDHAFAPLHLERIFLGRHKFYHFRVWYRDPLANYVKDMLLDSRTLNRPYVNRNSVETIVKGHLHQGQNFTTEIHKLVTLELIHRQFLDAR
ncbi:MAG TPA: asparagine synthase-related protein [Candidatus Acidoferrum sp.]